MQIAIVDLGLGNLRSVVQAFTKVAPSIDVMITDDAACINAADKLVLPGQGAVGSWFRELDQRQLRGSVKKALDEKPVLGICVGMQALFAFCEEDGGQIGLGLFEGEVRHFCNYHQDGHTQQRISIPKMGWNKVLQSRDHPLWSGIENNSYFYFLHSYCANMTEREKSSNEVMGIADYYHEYVAAVGRANVFATQFHPEKSQDDGLQLIKNFSDWNGL